MNEQAIKDAYDLFVKNGYQKSIDDFKSLIASNPQALQDSYSLFTSNGYQKPIEDYKELMGLGGVKKKAEPSTTASPLAGSSSASQQPPVAKSTADGGLVPPKLDIPKPVAESTMAPLTPAKAQTQMEKQNKVAISIEESKQKIRDKAKLIDETPKEKKHFTGKFGEALQAMDEYNPLFSMAGLFGLGDVVDDMGRAIDAGNKQGALVTPSNKLMLSGKNATPEQVKKYIAAAKDVQNLQPSDEMTSFTKTYMEEGGDIYGFLKGIAKNPSVLPEIILSSTASMLNKSSAAAAGTVAGGAAAGGAAAGAAAGGVGAVPGATAAFASSIPWAIGAAGTAMETGLTFSELLNEKLEKKGLEFTEENVKKILEDESELRDIRTKSISRGVTIGAIDALTGRVAGRVGAKLAEGTGAAKIKAALASSGIEMAGGSAGEAAGRVVAGQPMDVAEIAFEGVAEAPMAIADVTAEILRRPTYKINGEKRTEADVDELIRTASPEDLSKIQIDIKNDAKGYGKKIQDIVTTEEIRKEVKNSNEGIDDNTIESLVSLEKELKNFEGATTQSGKDKASSIRSQIKTIQENAVQKQTTDEGVLRTEQPQLGLQEVVEGDQKPQVPAVEDEAVTTQQEQAVKVESQEVSTENLPAFNEGIQEVAINANEYKQSLPERNKERSSEPVLKLFPKVSKAIANLYDKIMPAQNEQKVKDAYDAMVRETLDQFKFIVSKGLKVERYAGEGEPYANSKEMLKDLKENKTLKFLPNEVAFGQGPATSKDNIALQPSGVKLDDGYELTNSEVFRIVHDYFGHGILGNQFGPIGEENATLQHVDLYSDAAAPAVIFQTRGQNSWVNFSGANAEAIELRKRARSLEKEGKTEEAAKLLAEADKMFKFAEPKIAIFPNEFNFKRHETARRISEKDDVDSRADKRADELSSTLETYSTRSRGTRGVNKRDVRRTESVRGNDVNVVAEYTLDDKVNQGILKLFPLFKGVQKIYEITNGDVYQKMMKESLKDNPFAASVTVHSPEDFNQMRMFITEDGSTGITLTKEGFLGGAFSSSDRPNNLAQLLVLGVKEGATTAEAFDTVLPDYYTNFGFKAVSRTAFNDEFKPMVSNGALKDWDYETYKKFNGGRPDVVFFIYDGGDRNTIEDRLGLFDSYKLYEKNNTKSYDKDGYAEAEEYMKQAAIKRLEYDLEKEGVSLKTQEEVAVEEISGYDRMMTEVDGIIEKSRNRGADEAKIADNVMQYVMGSKVYENATDVQREQLVRDVNKMFGIKEKAAPKAQRLLEGVQDVNKITMSEKELLKKQIKDLSRGAKDAKAAWTAASTELSKYIKTFADAGKITAKQAANVVRRFSKVNMFSNDSVAKFVDYMSKVFADAEYASKLDTATKLKKDLAKLSRNKDKNADLRTLAKKFLDIDPSTVEDIDKYNEVANSIKQSVKGSTIRGEKVKFVDMVNIDETTSYINDMLKDQQKKLYEARLAEVQELMGIDASEMKYEDLLKLLESEEPVSKKDETIIRDTIKKAFDAYSDTIKQIMADDEFEFTKAQKQLITKFMQMDLNILTAKEALAAVDALANFIQNKSTAKMQTVVSDYIGEKNAATLVEDGVVAKPLQMYWSKGIGRLMGEQFASLPILFEKLFKGVKLGGRVEEMSGMTELKNAKSKAEKASSSIIDEYVSKFYKKKANNEDFNSEYNITERGLLAFMSRNVIGTLEEAKAEFNRRKGLIEESIEALSKGSEREKTKAAFYKKAYSKILDGAEDINDVRQNVDKTNIDAVDFWVDKWDSIYDGLADVSLGVYNKVLDKDMMYTPDRFSRLDRLEEKTQLSQDESMFHGNTNSLYKKEAGVLMAAERPESLPRDSKKDKPKMYIDLSFDRNNANSMYDALVDMETAAPIRQVESFINSKSFDEIFPNEKDAKILKERIQLFVRNIRNKNVFDDDTISAAVRKLNTISAIGVGQALGGITQPIKQVIPVAMNTLINAGNLDLGAIFNKGKNDFITNSGYAIANRGVESLTQISSINKLIDLAAKSEGIKALKYIEKANKMWLDIFLVKPDVFIARSSWLTYYEKSLKEQGIDPSTIDYSTHEVNKEAGDYAQRMVDRQQNTSDSDLQGKLFSSKDSKSQIFVKTVLPFANFRMNQMMRLSSDVTTLTSKTASAEDKKVAASSLAGFGVEMATFKLISAGAAILLGGIANKLMGDDEDEEEKDKRINGVIKGVATGTVTDILSPVPFLDMPIAAGVNTAMDKVQSAMDVADEEKLSLYGNTKADMTKSLGTLGIAIERANQLSELSSLANTGEFTDDFGRVKKISEENQDVLKNMIGVAALTNIGLAPSEVNNVIRNSIKIAKRDSETDAKIDERTLLQGYENRGDMKRYDPELYEKTFGPGSDYYESTKDEREMKKKEKEEERKRKDEEFGYQGASKENYYFGPRKQKSGGKKKGYYFGPESDVPEKPTMIKRSRSSESWRRR
jgi:hypothetical protein